jgi:hypothetical protein
MTFNRHSLRVLLLLLVAGFVLTRVASRTDVLFADGLRYVGQAKQIDAGAWHDGLLKAVDHPVYPLSIAAAHRAMGGDDPVAWQGAGQAASVLAGILLVVPLYLVAVELFGPGSAWLGVLLVYLTPLNPRVMADVLSESTFLLFWTWGVWGALRFLREGAFRWLPLVIAASALAYFTRPEGLLLPAALVATLLVMPVLRSTRLNWPRWWAAVGLMVIGPALVLGPYVALEGGLATKPAVARLLGKAPPSPAGAVERARPLDPDETAASIYFYAAKSAYEAVRDAVSLPLFPLALLGLALAWPYGEKARGWLFFWITGAAAMLALIRLHATGGYCTPRHAMLVALPLIAAAGSACDRLARSLAIPGRLLGQGAATFRPGPAVWAGLLALYAAWSAPTLFRPLNAAYAGYREAAAWMAAHTAPDARVLDLTGWSLYYGGRTGYTFHNLGDLQRDPNVAYVVVRGAHLRGPWNYCDLSRRMTAGATLVATFPEHPQPGQSRVFIYDRRPEAGAVARGDAAPSLR